MARVGKCDFSVLDSLPFHALLKRGSTNFSAVESNSYASLGIIFINSVCFAKKISVEKIRYVSGIG